MSKQLTAAALWLAGCLCISATSAAAGPFSTMGGQWSGGGKLTKSDGTSERLRCRASNSVSQGGDQLDLSIRCASDSYKFDLSGYLTNRSGTVTGQWSETNYNSAGSINGRASGSHVSALAVGNTFSARLSLSGSSSHLSVTIRPEATQVTQVSLSLRKR